MRLDRPTACSLDIVDDIVAERTREPNKTFFRSISAEWKERVDFYINNSGSPEHVPTWPAVMARAVSFQNLYSHPADDSVQGRMLAVLRDHDLDVCPSCGAPTPPETLDHYLPQSAYPHFAVTPLNLTPMCDPCQRRKKESTGDAVSPRFFIHPYFDVFSVEQITQLEIHPPFPTPTFVLSPHPTLTAEETSLVATHLRELQISRRYVRFFRNEHRRLLRNSNAMRVKGLNVRANIESWKSGHAHPTMDSWHHIFYEAVLRNDALMTYLTTAALPPFL